MDELKFVLKGLGIAVLVTVVLQVKIGGETLEIKSDRLLHHSAVGQFLNQTAEGAAMVMRQGSQIIRQFWSNSFGKSEKPAQEAGWTIQARHQRAKFEKSEAQQTETE